MAETSAALMKRYLEDAAAAENHSIAQLKNLEGECDNAEIKELFRAHRIETEQQYQRLVARLKTLNGSPSNGKGLLAYIFGLVPKTAQAEPEKEERTTQNLMMAYAVENSEVAMYESLITIAEAAGDSETSELARSIQTEEKEAADKIWKLLPAAALESCARVTERS